MGWHSTCRICGEITRYACDRHDSKRDENEEIMRCPNATADDKRAAMRALGFDTDWTEQ